MQSAYTQPLSLWSLVEHHAEPHEQDELKDMLGRSLVEQSLELHAEIEMLLEIWRDVREESLETCQPKSMLPEPPNQRDRLVQEICFFVENVKEQAKKKGIDPNYFLKNHNSEILNYAADKSRPESARSRVSHSSDGKETPMTVLSPDRLDLAYNMTDEVEAVNKQINFMEFGEVCTSLRSYLEKEVEQLLEDIAFLQSCLDEAADVRDCQTPSLSSREPTLLELREERTMLEKELFATERMSSTPAVMKPRFNTSNRVLPRTPPTHGESLALSPPPSRSGPSRPLRARHDVMGNMTTSRNNQDTHTKNIKFSDHDSRAAGDGDSDVSSIEISPQSLQSSPSQDTEFFGFSRSSSRQGQETTTDFYKEIAGSSDEEDMEEKTIYRQQSNLSYEDKTHHNSDQTPNIRERPPRAFSKSGSSLKDEKSPLTTVLPSPPSFPSVSRDHTFAVAADPQPSRSDLAIKSREPTPPQHRRTTPNRTQRRRTVSPRPRLRVVDVTNVVGMHAGKGDSALATTTAERVLSLASPDASTFSSVTASPSPSSATNGTALTFSAAQAILDSPSEGEPQIRPRSANRFREMVLGCRDAQ